MAERFLVVLPTYNESQNLSQIVPVILSQDDRLEVLVVDDNSPDGTGKIADVLAGGIARVHVLHRQSKEGLGRAYLAGFRWGLDHGFDALIEMECDLAQGFIIGRPMSLESLLKRVSAERGRNVA